jgi:hypothetical protein
MNAAQAITMAYQLANIRSIELQDVSEGDTSIGLAQLNFVLDFPSIRGNLLPYYSHTTFNTIVNQPIYLQPGLIQLDTLTFNLADNSDVRLPMVRDTRRQFYSCARVDNVNSLPYHYCADRVPGGMRIDLYFYPADVYVMKIDGRYALGQVSTPSDVLMLDMFYIEYIIYELADRLSSLFETILVPNTKERLMMLREQINNLAGQDLSINKISLFKGKGVDIDVWGNLSGGYMPTSSGLYI